MTRWERARGRNARLRALAVAIALTLNACVADDEATNDAGVRDGSQPVVSPTPIEIVTEPVGGWLETGCESDPDILTRIRRGYYPGRSPEVLQRFFQWTSFPLVGGEVVEAEQLGIRRCEVGHGDLPVHGGALANESRPVHDRNVLRVGPRSGVPQCSPNCVGSHSIVSTSPDRRG